MAQRKERRERRKREEKAFGKGSAAAKRKLNREEKRANVRLKYGPSGKPAPVTVRRLDGTTGEWVDVGTFDQSRIRPSKAYRSSRVQPRDEKFSPRLNAQARELGFKNYADYLLSPWWRGLRAKVLMRDLVCQRCSSAEGLQVHHVAYVRLGAESLDDLTTLCSRCHRALHQRHRS